MKMSVMNSLEEIEQITQRYTKEVNQMTDNFVATLHKQGVTPEIIEELINSIE